MLLNGSGKMGAKNFMQNTSKIAVLCDSAGGYLTFFTGLRVQPPPTVLVSYWGYGDLIGPWCSDPVVSTLVFLGKIMLAAVANLCSSLTLNINEKAYPGDQWSLRGGVV